MYDRTAYPDETKGHNALRGVKGLYEKSISLRIWNSVSFLDATNWAWSSPGDVETRRNYGFILGTPYSETPR